MTPGLCTMDLQQEEVEVHTARCHPWRWFGGGREGETTGGGEGSKAEEDAGGGGQSTSGREDIVERGVRSGNPRLKEGSVKQNLDVEQCEHTKAA